jgi:hypothetical protein
MCVRSLCEFSGVRGEGARVALIHLPRCFLFILFDAYISLLTDVEIQAAVMLCPVEERDDPVLRDGRGTISSHMYAHCVCLVVRHNC